MRFKLQDCTVRVFLPLLIGLWVTAGSAHASMSLLMEEPFGLFGSFNPTGHAAIYLNNVCADTPTRLRLCREGEMGVVISRYHKVNGYDWIAIPLIPYLYAVEDLSEVPDSATPTLETQLRETYRREHLLDVAPDDPDGTPPRGEWIQLVGAAYDRRIYGFQLATTHEQDEHIIAKLNDSRNRSHFNLFFNNCADFSRSVVRTAYPKSIAPNAIADFGLTTPKHLARSITRFGKHQPEVEFRTFQIAQVPGTIPRSRHVDGIAESLVRSKRYFVPIIFVSPTTAASLLAAYVGTGRFHAPANAPIMDELRPMSAAITLDPDAIVLPAQTEDAMPTLACSVPAPETVIERAPPVVESMLTGDGPR